MIDSARMLCESPNAHLCGVQLSIPCVHRQISFDVRRDRNTRVALVLLETPQIHFFEANNSTGLFRGDYYGAARLQRFLLYEAQQLSGAVRGYASLVW